MAPASPMDVSNIANSRLAHIAVGELGSIAGSAWVVLRARRPLDGTHDRMAFCDCFCVGSFLSLG